MYTFVGLIPLARLPDCHSVLLDDMERSRDLEVVRKIVPDARYP